jgi:hypothetical protein
MRNHRVVIHDALVKLFMERRTDKVEQLVALAVFGKPQNDIDPGIDLSNSDMAD